MKRKNHDIFEWISQDEFSFSRWVEANALNFNDEDMARVEKACNMAEKQVSTTLKLQLNTFAAGLEIAEVLTHFSVDSDTLCAAILLPSEISGTIAVQEIKDTLSPAIGALVEGAAQMEAMRNLQQESGAEQDSQQVESLRKMLLGMVNDARVVLLKLADRVVSLRHLKSASRDVQRTFAEETRDIFAPLANRLGIGQLKWELEDWAFCYLQPDTYHQIANSLQERRVTRENYINSVVADIQKSITSMGIVGEVSGRVKHIYSIWKKMSRKGLPFQEIYDIRAVRILVEKIPDCYAALGIVHGLWQHIPKEFDDYVTSPKDNGYRSIHTAVLGPENKVVEIQIRTFQMHEEAEQGIAAHWAYKEEANLAKVGVDEKIAWMRQLLEWQSELSDANSEELIQEFKNSISDERVFAFSPQGKVVDLPYGSTPIDFAYNIHTSVGHRCIGAKVNGRIVPLTHTIATGEVLEIMTQKEESPSRDWLVPYHGYIKSSRTRHKIKQFFNKLLKEENESAGQQLLEKELARHALENVDSRLVAQRLHLSSESELYTKIGMGDLGINQVINRIIDMQQNLVPKDDIEPSLHQKSTRKSLSDIQVDGVGDLLTQIAQCCKPIPGEAIIGFVSKNRGIVIHRSSCPQVAVSMNEHAERMVDVAWQQGMESKNAYAVDLLLHSLDRKSLLKDITTVLSNENASITDLSTTRHNEQVEIRMEVELTQLDDLQRIIALLRQLPNVFNVVRAHG